MMMEVRHRHRVYDDGISGDTWNIDMMGVE